MHGPFSDRGHRFFSIFWFRGSLKILGLAQKQTVEHRFFNQGRDMGSLDGGRQKLLNGDEKDGLPYEGEEIHLTPPGQPCKGDTLVEAALKVLNAADPWKKAEFGDFAAKLWFEGCLSEPYDSLKGFHVPHKPARSPTVHLVAPQQMPKLGKAGSLQSRRAILHSLVHTESWAIDLSWDIIARFGKQEAMPREFFDDFVKVAQDEGRHFKLLSVRLEELGSFYGALPAHDGLWDSAEATSKDFLARLAVEHCVHEARGLDVLPITISRFRKGGDDTTADLLETVVYPEEITHCAAGLKWFRYVCLTSGKNFESKNLEESDMPQNDKKGSAYVISKGIYGNQQSNDESNVSGCHCFGNLADLDSVGENPKDVIGMFHIIVRKYFRGPLKPPFNEKARQAAGFGPEWYLPLTVK